MDHDDWFCPNLVECRVLRHLSCYFLFVDFFQSCLVLCEKPFTKGIWWSRWWQSRILGHPLWVVVHHRVEFLFVEHDRNAVFPPTRTMWPHRLVEHEPIHLDRFKVIPVGIIRVDLLTVAEELFNLRVDGLLCVFWSLIRHELLDGSFEMGRSMTYFLRDVSGRRRRRWGIGIGRTIGDLIPLGCWGGQVWAIWMVWHCRWSWRRRRRQCCWRRLTTIN